MLFSSGSGLSLPGFNLHVCALQFNNRLKVYISIDKTLRKPSTSKPRAQFMGHTVCTFTLLKIYPIKLLFVSWRPAVRMLATDK